MASSAPTAEAAGLPRVAILGRPNVGKSTLFNRLVGRRAAIVDDRPGVTRDRREGRARLFDLDFVAIDTAGLEDARADSLAARMQQQAEAALADAAVVLFVTDALSGLTESDRHFARWLRRAADVPVIAVVNKCEGTRAGPGILEAFELGLGEPVAVSAEHGEGLADLFAALAPVLPAPSEVAVDAERPLKLAIVGRPNAGKSTLVNRLLGSDRLLTGPEAGVTRDAISVTFDWHAKPVEIVDTAGLRRKAKVTERLEKAAAADARRAIDLAEVVVLLLDATMGLEAQDLRIADMVLAEGRALIVAVNKWDAAEDASRLFNGIKAALATGLSQARDVPLLTVSALTGKGLPALMEAAFATRELWQTRISTSALNRWFEAAITRNPPPAPRGRRIRLRYITQASSRPPTFVVFGNRLDELPPSYGRYLVNSLRTDLGLAGIPLRLHFRARQNPFDG